MQEGTFSLLPPGTRVRTFTGYTGTIYKAAKRAAADIKDSATELELDRQPYTVAMDRGGFSCYRGYHLDVIAPGTQGYEVP